MLLNDRPASVDNNQARISIYHPDWISRVCVGVSHVKFVTALVVVCAVRRSNAHDRPEKGMRIKLAGRRMKSARMAAGVIFLSALVSGSVRAADQVTAKTQPAAAASSGGDDPCDDYLSTIDRPMVTTGPCVLKPWHVSLEQGFETGSLADSDFTHLSQFPQSEVRLGLPESWEVNVFSPNYNIATEHAGVGGRQVTGFGDLTLGANMSLPPSAISFSRSTPGSRSRPAAPHSAMAESREVYRVSSVTASHRNWGSRV